MNETNNTPVTKEEILNVVAQLDEIHFNGLKAEYPNCEANWSHLVPVIGKRYVKVIAVRPGSEGGSAFAFIDIATGDIYKPAGWASPAKGIRGNIRRGSRENLWGAFYKLGGGLFCNYAR